MSQQTHLLADSVQLAPQDHVLFVNSAGDPFVASAARQLSSGTLILAEDNIAYLHKAMQEIEQATGGRTAHVRHVALHAYLSHIPPQSVDRAIMNILYQPSNAWIFYGLQLAAYALKPGGALYVQGAKDRGILTVAKRMQAISGNVATLAIGKGQRVIRSRASDTPPAVPAPVANGDTLPDLLPLVFADGELDEGTSLLLDALDIRPTDIALDLGCGAGYIGLHIARGARQGYVTMLDVSLAAVAVARLRVTQSGLTNIAVMPSDGAQAVLQQHFDLVVTNPPFHRGGIQTTATAERFIREAAQILRPRGRLYLVANRFLKYEPGMRACFQTVEEVGGNTRYKVLRAESAH